MYHPLCLDCINYNVCIDKCAGYKKLNIKERNRVWFWNKIGAYCRICGYDKSIRALHLHHLDTSQKDNNKDCLASWLLRSPKYIINKCLKSKFIILCANCHAEVHAGLIKIDENYPGDNKFSKDEIIKLNFNKFFKG